MHVVRSLLVLSTILALGALPGCGADLGDDDDEAESEEPAGTTHDELRSGVSCKTTTEKAYANGSPYSIQIITVGGKKMSKPAGHAFLKLQAAADKAGANISISSGFRTMAEQQYFWNCYQTKKCNGGNKAARPGYGPHQRAEAVDITPSSSAWLQKNAARFGFIPGTVAGEPWHFKFTGKDPGGPCAGGSSAPATGDDEDDPPSTTPVAGGITWVAPRPDTTMKNGFTVKARASTSSIVRVVYSQGTFVFGSSTNAASDFALGYTFKYLGDKTLTVKGYDARGGLVATDNVDFTLE
ncbi:MAG: D-alanyl-D-alanine carboxypeptidase family protein [Deltaproteobacteria bacterium]|nr:D-alanyl-D-alanine carboxypeptidase family protein [Deltaproteobacteria bacterium]